MDYIIRTGQTIYSSVHGELKVERMLPRSPDILKSWFPLYCVNKDNTNSYQYSYDLKMSLIDRICNFNVFGDDEIIKLRK